MSDQAGYHCNGRGFKSGGRFEPELKTLYRVAAYRKEMSNGHHHCQPVWNLMAIIALG